MAAFCYIWLLKGFTPCGLGRAFQSWGLELKLRCSFGMKANLKGVITEGYWIDVPLTINTKPRYYGDREKIFSYMTETQEGVGDTE